MDISCIRRNSKRLRAFLGGRGAKKGNLSRSVEQAVNRSLFEDTVEPVQERNRHYPPALESGGGPATYSASVFSLARSERRLVYDG